jgi:hypothetical protein
MKKNLKNSKCYNYVIVHRMADYSPALCHKIMDLHGLSGDNSFQRVKSIMKAIIKAENEGLIYSELIIQKGRQRIIQDYTDEANIIYEAQETSMSNAQCTCLLNTYRAKIQEHRQSKKSGKDDAGTAWAEARVAQFKQFQAQLSHPGWPKVNLDALVIWDENHRKIVLGHTSKAETRVCRNADGAPCSLVDGGRYPPRKPRTSVK